MRPLQDAVRPAIRDMLGGEVSRMRAWIATASALWTLGAAGGEAPAVEDRASQASARAARLEDLAWLEGRWRRESKRGPAYEEWRRLEDRVIFGSAYRLSDDGTRRVPLEDLHLTRMGGEIFYTAKVGENAYPVAFRLTRLEGRDATFENPGHDHPQLIRYRQDSAGTLHVSVEGPAAAGPPRLEFRFVRLADDEGGAPPGNASE